MQTDSILGLMNLSVVFQAYQHGLLSVGNPMDDGLVTIEAGDRFRAAIDAIELIRDLGSSDSVRHVIRCTNNTHSVNIRTALA